MELTIKRKASFRSIKQLIAKCSLQLIGPAEDGKPAPTTQIGYIEAHIIDKTTKSTYTPSQGNGKYKVTKHPQRPIPTLAWKQEVLKSNLTEPSHYSPLHYVSALFHPSGRPKTSTMFSTRALRRKELAYISYIFTEREARGSGLGSVCLNVLLTVLPKLKSPDCFAGPCWLMPGGVDFYVPDDEYFSVPGAERMALAERKRTANLERLVRFYKKNGYSLWHVEGEADEEPIRLMGIDTISSENTRWKR